MLAVRRSFAFVVEEVGLYLDVLTCDDNLFYLAEEVDPLEAIGCFRVVDMVGPGRQRRHCAVVVHGQHAIDKRPVALCAQRAALHHLVYVEVGHDVEAGRCRVGSIVVAVRGLQNMQRGIVLGGCIEVEGVALHFEQVFAIDIDVLDAAERERLLADGLEEASQRDGLHACRCVGEVFAAEEVVGDGLHVVREDDSLDEADPCIEGIAPGLAIGIGGRDVAADVNHERAVRAEIPCAVLANRAAGGQSRLYDFIIALDGHVLPDVGSLVGSDEVGRNDEMDVAEREVVEWPGFLPFHTHFTDILTPVVHGQGRRCSAVDVDVPEACATFEGIIFDALQLAAQPYCFKSRAAAEEAAGQT